MREKRPNIVQIVGQNPATLQILCLTLVPVMIIFVPILSHGILFHLEMSVGYILKNIPWVPILIVIGIAALLSLLHTPASVGVKVQGRLQNCPHPTPSTSGTGAMDDTNPPSLTHIDEDPGHDDGMPIKKSEKILT